MIKYMTSVKMKRISSDIYIYTNTDKEVTVMISNVYSYYLYNYLNKNNTRSSAHKPSELKSTYNKMLKINKAAPFYKVDISEDAQKYAIDLKENARELTNIANELSGSDENSTNMEIKKSAESSNESSVGVEYIGDNQAPIVNAFEVDVKQLATPQINTGNYLQPNSKYLTPGKYTFDLDISDLTYEFELAVDNIDTTKSIQDKISRLINRSNLGLQSDVLSDRLSNTAITIESEGTGVSTMKPTLFTIDNVDTTNDDEAETKKHNLVDVLGLNRTSQYPSNAIFLIDGNETASSTNSFILNKSFQLDLKEVTDSNPVTISLKDDGATIVDSISQLVDGYNKLISVTAIESNDKFEGNQKLKREFTSITQSYNELLKANGLDVSDDGTLKINNESIQDATSSGNITKIFFNLGTFKNAIQSKAETIGIDPMNYVNNKIVAYKNPQKSFLSPYNTSAYSGMMFSGYI